MREAEMQSLCKLPLPSGTRISGIMNFHVVKERRLRAFAAIISGADGELGGGGLG